MKVIFLGTPDFSVPTLDAIAKSNHELIAVITQPDKPVGRGKKIVYSPVKEYAKAHNIDVLQYQSLRKDGVNDLKHLNPDIMVTCAYGQILSEEVLSIPKYGVINVHASLLPKYRGSAPINWAIISGETESGVTLMRTVKKVDAGDILLQKRIAIGDTETAGELYERLAKLGGETIVEGLDQIENQTAAFVVQNEEEASHFPMFKKEDGRIDFSKSAKEVVDFIRGVTPWPSAQMVYEDAVIKVFKAEECDLNGQIGEVLACNAKDGLIVACGKNAIKILELQYPNSHKMDVFTYINGRKFEVGKIID